MSLQTLATADPQFSEKFKEVKDEGPKKDLDYYIGVFKFYYLPIIVIGIFLAIMIFGTLPSLRLMLNNRSEIGKVEKEVEQKDRQLILLKSLRANSTTNRNYLTNIKRIAPTEKTNVAKYQQDIKGVASKNRLTVDNSHAGEEIIANNEQTANELVLIEIPTEFTVSGRFSDIKSFLEDIYTQDDFLIIQQMNFQRITERPERWQMKITLVKYQFDESDEVKLNNVYTTVPNEARPVQSVLEFIDKKYLQGSNPPAQPTTPQNPTTTN